MLYVHICMSSMHIGSVCPCCMSLTYVLAAYSCRTSMTYAHAACPCIKSMLHFPALHVCATWPCCISCPRCMFMLRVFEMEILEAKCSKKKWKESKWRKLTSASFRCEAKQKIVSEMKQKISFFLSLKQAKWKRIGSRFAALCLQRKKLKKTGAS
jgi:hypothetical protein